MLCDAHIGLAVAPLRTPLVSPLAFYTFLGLFLLLVIGFGIFLRRSRNAVSKRRAFAVFHILNVALIGGLAFSVFGWDRFGFVIAIVALDAGYSVLTFRQLAVCESCTRTFNRRQILATTRQCPRCGHPVGEISGGPHPTA